MQKLVGILVLLLASVHLFSQSIHDLEVNHKFKTITIGMPINSIDGNYLVFSEIFKGRDVYYSTDAYLHSVFGIQMDRVCIFAKDNKVDGIGIVKSYKASDQPDGSVIFSARELDIIKNGATSLFGKPTHSMDERTSEYNIIGYSWQSKSYIMQCYIKFYGTFVGYDVIFTLDKYTVDF